MIFKCFDYCQPKFSDYSPAEEKLNTVDLRIMQWYFKTTGKSSEYTTLKAMTNKTFKCLDDSCYLSAQTWLE